MSAGVVGIWQLTDKHRIEKLDDRLPQGMVRIDVAERRFNVFRQGEQQENPSVERLIQKGLPAGDH